MTFLIVLAFIIVSAFIDAEHLLDGEYIENHKSRFIQRGVFILALWLHSASTALAGFLLFIALFDQLLNFFWGKDWFYLGDTSKWDKFWKGRERLLIIVKLISFIVALSILT
jgi:hypothetical protein